MEYAGVQQALEGCATYGHHRTCCEHRFCFSLHRTIIPHLVSDSTVTQNMDACMTHIETLSLQMATKLHKVEELAQSEAQALKVGPCPKTR